VVKLFLVAALLRYVVTVAEKLNTYENVVSFIPQILVYSLQTPAKGEASDQ
jgi:hypothetical protein